MTRNVGIEGGSSLCELGPVSDVALFFECVDMFSKWRHPNQDWSLITDRLFRRYLRIDELDEAAALMEKIKQLFSELPSSSVQWNDYMIVDSKKSLLNPSKTTLVEVFEKFFEYFEHCVESAKINYEAFKTSPGYQYEPVRFIISDRPQYYSERSRPLEEYDSLNGLPFWLQPVKQN